jgi:ABC-type phosphate transport system substrate-binding protein
MRKTPDITLASLHDKTTFDKCWNLLKQDKLRNKIYAKEGAAAERFKEAIAEADADEIYREIWLPVARLFQEDQTRRKVEKALEWLLDPSKQHRLLGDN